MKSLGSRKKRREIDNFVFTVMAFKRYLIQSYLNIVHGRRTMFSNIQGNSKKYEVYLLPENNQELRKEKKARENKASL